jgi:hypothetical protein
MIVMHKKNNDDMIVSSQVGVCNLQKLKTNKQHEHGFKILGQTYNL